MRRERKNLGHQARRADEADARHPLLPIDREHQDALVLTGCGSDHRLRSIVGERADHEGQAATPRPAHRHRVDDLGAHLRQQLELERIDRREVAGGGDELGVRLQHAADVLEELAALRPQGHRQRNGGEIGATAPEGRELAVGADALEAGDDRHEPIGQRRAKRT